jgi:hypothetical protein
MTRLLLALALASTMAAAAPAPIGPCGPVDRPHEPIELPGARLIGLGRTPLEQIGLVAARSGGLAAIPFQIDERRGRKIALADGADPSDDDRPGVLDADDVLVFMACDTGLDVSEAVLRQAYPTAAAWRAIRIDDPLTGTAGHA